MKKVNFEKVVAVAKTVVLGAVKEVKATTEATGAIITALPACALNKEDLTCYIEKDITLSNFQSILGQQEFDACVKDYEKVVSEKRLAECRESFIANCEVLFDTIDDSMTFMEVLRSAIVVKLEDAHAQTVKDIKREAINQVLDVLESVTSEEIIMNMHNMSSMVTELLPSLKETKGDEVEDLMAEIAETIAEVVEPVAEAEVIEEASSFLMEEEVVAKVCETSNVIPFAPKPIVYVDDQINSILEEASKWLTEETIEARKEFINETLKYELDEAIKNEMSELRFDIAIGEYNKDLEIYNEVIKLISNVITSKKFRVSSVDKAMPVMETISKALIVADRRLAIASKSVSGDYDPKQTFEFVELISQEIKSQRKREGFVNCVFATFDKAVKISDDNMSTYLIELTRYAI